MSKILVSGMTNIETTVKCDGFPVEYCPVRYPFFGVGTTVSGVGYNVAKALTLLNDQVDYLSIIGRDFLGESVKAELNKAGVRTDFILNSMEETAQSVIIYDESGRRQINLDLKNMQEISYDERIFMDRLLSCDFTVLCNINFNRKYLESTKKMGKKIATDIHVIADINDSYNNDFIKYADVLFMSNENISGREREFLLEIASRYDNEVIVAGLGSSGAMLYTRDSKDVKVIPAVKTRDVINTIGAGDALFSCFIHYYAKGLSAIDALKKAVVFASYKIGEKGAACGFLTEDELDEVIVKYL